MKAYRIVSIVVLFIIVFATGCTPAATPTPAASGGQQAPVAQSSGDKVIKIYASWPMQGAMIPEGTAMLNAAKLALEEAKYEAAGYKLELVFLDDASPTTGSWDGAIEAGNAQKCIGDENCLVYFATYNSGAAKISMPLTNEASIAQITPANSYPGLTKEGFSTGEPGIYRPTGKVNYFRTFGADDLQGASGAAWAKCLGYKKVYILDDRQLYGKGIADVFDKSARELGLEVVGHDGVESVSIDFRALLTKVKASGADLVYFGGLVDSGGPQILQQMDALGFFDADIPMMTDDAMYNDAVPAAVGADLLNGHLLVTFASPALDQLPTEIGQNFYKNYKAKYNTDPIGWSLYSYNSVLVILDSIKRAQSQLDAAKTATEKRAAILDAMRQTKDLPGVSGPITFDQNGDPTTYVMSGFRYEDGRYNWKENISGDMTCK